MHAHAWPLYTAAKLLGADFHPNGLRFKPVIPLNDYEFNTPLLGFRKTPYGYSGWYAPLVAGHWTIEVALPHTELARLKHLSVNGQGQSPFVHSQWRARFAGASTLGNPVRWEIS